MKKLLILLVITRMLFAGGDIVPVYEPVVAPEATEFMESDMYVFVSGGISNLDTNAKIPRGYHGKKGLADHKASLFEIGLGHYLNKEYFYELAYQSSGFDLFNVDTIYVSMNYDFLHEDNAFASYIGILAGYSRLKWSESPVNYYVNKSLTSEQTVYGGQIGASYRLNSMLSLLAKYQLIQYSHNTLINNRGEIASDYTNNFMAGVKYEF